VKPQTDDPAVLATPDHTPLYLGEGQSLRCGVRQGWYAVDQHGNLQSGPYPTRENCDENLVPPQE
jgi:hypothetical protein